MKKKTHKIAAPITYVTASDVARRYSVTQRYILKLAAAGTIPCIRIGKKTVRFDIYAVAETLEGGN